MTATRIDEILESVANGGDIEDAAVELRALMWQRNDLRFAIRYIRAAVTPPVMDNALETVRIACKNITKDNRLEPINKAAPDMLEALEEVIRAHGIYDAAVSKAPKPIADRLMATGDKIRAAIAKAKGEEGKR